mmetsp:Transcript_74957/g.160487  ORF Transcript_74957/g.160487 Transcript_74957/m.160487 type:complete len:313 (-) Transcript_74957:538-1476(-)
MTLQGYLQSWRINVGVEFLSMKACSVRASVAVVLAAPSLLGVTPTILPVAVASLAIEGERGLRLKWKWSATDRFKRATGTSVGAILEGEAVGRGTGCELRLRGELVVGEPLDACPAGGGVPSSVAHCVAGSVLPCHLRMLQCLHSGFEPRLLLLEGLVARRHRPLRLRMLGGRSCLLHDATDALLLATPVPLLRSPLLLVLLGLLQCAVKGLRDSVGAAAVVVGATPLLLLQLPTRLRSDVAIERHCQGHSSACSNGCLNKGRPRLRRGGLDELQIVGGLRLAEEVTAHSRYGQRPNQDLLPAVVDSARTQC